MTMRSRPTTRLILSLTGGNTGSEIQSLTVPLRGPAMLFSSMPSRERPSETVLHELLRAASETC